MGSGAPAVGVGVEELRQAAVLAGERRLVGVPVDVTGCGRVVVPSLLPGHHDFARMVTKPQIVQHGLGSSCRWLHTGQTRNVDGVAPV